jgi:hypothetical protein
MSERRGWAGHHNLEFCVYSITPSFEKESWYWKPRGRTNSEGPFPTARAAFLDAVHSYYWPDGADDCPSSAKCEDHSDDLQVRV